MVKENARVLPFQNKSHPARGAYSEVNPEAIEEMNIIFAIREIAVQKSFEPCAIESTDPEPIRQFLVRFGSNGLRREWSCNKRPDQY
jgi:hypothetical protein